MSQKRADGILALIAIAWGSSYIFMKMGLSLGIFNLIALRFGIAFMITAVIFFKRLFKVNMITFTYGALLGLLLFCVMMSLMIGLQTTSASSAGFIAGTTVIFVPILQTLILRKRPTKNIIIGVLLVIIGIGLLTIDSTFSLEMNSLYVMLAAFIYAGQIIVTSHFSCKTDPLTLGVLQLGFTALFGFIFALFFERFELPNSTTEWLAVLGLSIVCSAFGFVLQPVAQKYTTPERAGILFALEPVFSAIFGFIFLHEILKIQGYMGAFFVFLGIMISGRKHILEKQRE